MKVFIRSSSLNSARPEVMAYYDDTTEVPDGAHGEGMTIMNVPANAFARERQDINKGIANPMPKLIDNWREFAKDTILTGEANRRINEVLPPEQEAAASHELLALVLQHGTDVSQWPADAKTRKAEIDDALNYVRAVRERARSYTSVPADPASDKAWPPRIKKFK
jgi:hypothetical protein